MLCVMLYPHKQTASLSMVFCFSVTSIAKCMCTQALLEHRVHVHMCTHTNTCTVCYYNIITIIITLPGPTCYSCMYMFVCMYMQYIKSGDTHTHTHSDQPHVLMSS